MSLNYKGVCTQKFCLWHHVPQFLPVLWRTFHRNSSLLRWEGAPMHCNPTPYPGLKKLGGKRHVPGWQIHTQYQTNRPGQSVQLLRRNIPRYQEMRCGQYRTRATISEQKTRLHLSQGLIVQCSCHCHMVRKYIWKQSQKRMQHVKPLNYFYLGKLLLNFLFLTFQKRF